MYVDEGIAQCKMRLRCSYFLFKLIKLIMGSRKYNHDNERVLHVGLTYIGKFFLPPVKSSFVEIRGFERIATMCYVDKLTYFTVLSLTHY